MIHNADIENIKSHLTPEAVLVTGRTWELNKKFRDIGGFWTGFGWAFKSECEEELKRILRHIPNIHIHAFPLVDGQTFDGYRHTYKAKFHQANLSKLEKSIEENLKGFALKEVSEEAIKGLIIDEEIKTQLLGLLKQQEWLREEIEYAQGIAKTLNAQGSPDIILQFINEISPNYFKEKPQEKPILLEYVDQNGKKTPFLHKEITAMLVAEGGRGKTHLCALLAACVASGVPFLRHFEVKKPGAVCLIVGENNATDIQRLLWKIRENISELIKENDKNKEHEKCAGYPNALERIEKYLCPLSVHGLSASLVNDAGCPTIFFNQLLKRLKEKEPSDGWQLVILDPASRFAGTGSEKDNAIATAFIARLEQISNELQGNPTILLSHHKSKAALNESKGQSDARGASGLTDGVRWQGNLVKDNKEDSISIFELTKTNFTPPLKKFYIRKNYKGIPEFKEWREE